MPRFCLLVLAGCMLLVVAARAEDAPKPPLAIPDAVYKGVVGKALDAVPMDPERRVALQRTNSVVSSTLTGRSLAAWAGLATNPLLLIAGIAWGLFAASNIKAKDAGAPVNTETMRHDFPESLEIAHREPVARWEPAW